MFVCCTSLYIYIYIFIYLFHILYGFPYNLCCMLRVTQPNFATMIWGALGVESPHGRAIMPDISPHGVFFRQAMRNTSSRWREGHKYATAESRERENILYGEVRVGTQ